MKKVQINSPCLAYLYVPTRTQFPWHEYVTWLTTLALKNIPGRCQGWLKKQTLTRNVSKGREGSTAFAYEGVN